jgi:hypothetical protein
VKCDNIPAHAIATSSTQALYSKVVLGGVDVSIDDLMPSPYTSYYDEFHYERDKGQCTWECEKPYVRS